MKSSTDKPVRLFALLGVMFSNYHAALNPSNFFRRSPQYSAVGSRNLPHSSARQDRRIRCNYYMTTVNGFPLMQKLSSRQKELLHIMTVEA